MPVPLLTFDNEVANWFEQTTTRQPQPLKTRRAAGMVYPEVCKNFSNFTADKPTGLSAGEPTAAGSQSLPETLS